MKTTIKMKTTSKIQTASKMTMTSKMKTALKMNMTTDVKPDMLSGVQTGHGIPHDIYNIRGIPHARTNRKDAFLCKDD